MRREDWFWVAVKVIGLWLAVEGIAEVTSGVVSLLGESVPGKLWVRVLVPALVTLGVGSLLLFAGENIVPQRDGEAASAKASASGIDAVGLFWASSKVIGLLVVLGALIVVVTILVIPGVELDDGRGSISLASWKGRIVLAAVPVSFVGTWLLFGEGIFRAASRNAGRM